TQLDLLVTGLKIKPAIEKPIGAGNKRGSGQGNGSLLQEVSSAGGGQLEPVRNYQLLETPTDRPCDPNGGPQEHGDQESEERIQRLYSTRRLQQGRPAGRRTA